MACRRAPDCRGWLQTVWWALRPLSFMRHCQSRYGDFFTIRIHGFGNIVALGDPALIKEVFTGEPRGLRRR